MRVPCHQHTPGREKAGYDGEQIRNKFLMRGSVNMQRSKIVLVCACLGLALQAAHPQALTSKTAGEDSALTGHAKGTFDVTTTALAPDEATGGPAIGRYALDKQFHGDLEAASKGQMLAASRSPWNCLSRA
jgi:hypothetical protein